MNTLTTGLFAGALVLSTSGTHPAPTLQAPQGSRLLRVVDLDGDGRADKLLQTPEGGLLSALNRGGGLFEAFPCEASVADVRDVLVADLDGDRFLDVYLVAHGANCALVGDGTGALREATAELGLADRGAGVKAELVDLDGLGADELVLHNESGDVIFWNRGVTWERDPQSPEVPVAAEMQPPAVEGAPVGRESDAAGSTTDVETSTARTDSRTPVGTDTARASRTGSSASTIGSVSTSSSAAGPLAEWPTCVLSIEDQSGGPCLLADSTPTLGHLYPLTQDLNVQPNGRVGMGTVNPQGDLHVASELDPEITFQNHGDTTIFRRVSLNLRHANGVGAEIEARRETGNNQGMSLAFKTEPVTGGALAEHMRIDPVGNIGIGTDTPLRALHVRQSSIGDLAAADLTDEDVVIEDNAEAWLGIYSSEAGSVGSGVALGQRGPLAADDDKWTMYRRSTDNGASLLFKYTTGTASPTSGDAALELTTSNVARIRVLELLGADVAERFPVSEEVEPGTVVEIDPDFPGQMRASREAYNRRVAGVVSGAGDLPAGAILGNLPGNEEAPPIALSGRVWTRCAAIDRAIEPGDLLTTSPRAGFAMKASDMDRAQGAVLGKAMTALAAGEEGLVLVLVNLQ
jgi:hypothetical protein